MKVMQLSVEQEELEAQLTTAVRELGRSVERILGVEYAGVLVLATMHGLWVLSPDEYTDTEKLLSVALDSLQKDNAKEEAECRSN